MSYGKAKRTPPPFVSRVDGFAFQQLLERGYVVARRLGSSQGLH